MCCSSHSHSSVYINCQTRVVRIIVVDVKYARAAVSNPTVNI